MSVQNDLPRGTPPIISGGLPPPAPPAAQKRVEFADGFESASVNAVRTPLPADVARAKQAVIQITTANTDREDNVAEVRAQLKPHLDVLANHFNNNRPTNEVALTQGAWKSLWYDDPDIDRVGPLKLDRTQIYQVVKEGFYYNVSDSKLKVFGLGLGTVQNFLRGNYDIIDPATADTQGQPRRNVIALEFDENRLWFGKLPRGANLDRLVDDVVDRDKTTLPVPGPRGIQGELWNLYVDQDIRISLGVQKGESKSEGEDMYILRRTDAVSE